MSVAVPVPNGGGAHLLYHPATTHHAQAKGVYWMNKSAKQGNFFAQARMGDAYRLGHGVMQDPQLATQWYVSCPPPCSPA